MVSRSCSPGYCGRRSILRNHIEHDGADIRTLRGDVQFERDVDVLSRCYNRSTGRRAWLHGSDRYLGRALDLGPLQVKRRHTRGRDYLRLTFLLTGRYQQIYLGRSEYAGRQTDSGIRDL